MSAETTTKPRLAISSAVLVMYSFELFNPCHIAMPGAGFCADTPSGMYTNALIWCPSVAKIVASVTVVVPPSVLMNLASRPPRSMRTTEITSNRLVLSENQDPRPLLPDTAMDPLRGSVDILIDYLHSRVFCCHTKT